MATGRKKSETLRWERKLVFIVSCKITLEMDGVKILRQNSLQLSRNKGSSLERRGIYRPKIWVYIRKKHQRKNKSR